MPLRPRIVCYYDPNKIKDPNGPWVVKYLTLTEAELKKGINLIEGQEIGEGAEFSVVPYAIYYPSLSNAEVEQKKAEAEQQKDSTVQSVPILSSRQPGAKEEADTSAGSGFVVIKSKLTGEELEDFDNRTIAAIGTLIQEAGGPANVSQLAIGGNQWKRIAQIAMALGIPRVNIAIQMVGLQVPQEDEIDRKLKNKVATFKSLVAKENKDAEVEKEAEVKAAAPSDSNGRSQKVSQVYRAPSSTPGAAARVAEASSSSRPVAGSDVILKVDPTQRVAPGGGAHK